LPSLTSVELYVEVVEEGILPWAYLANPAALEELKQQYRQRPEESSRPESGAYVREVSRRAFKGLILLVYDDPIFLHR